MVNKKYFLFKTFQLPVFLLLAGCMPSFLDTEESSSSLSQPQIGQIEKSETEVEETPTIKRENEILATMSLEEKVGQLFLARYPDTAASEYAIYYHLGGFIWFGKDFHDKNINTVKNEIRAIQEQSPIDLFMAVDEEGGDVTRMSSYPQYREEPFSSPQSVYHQNGWTGIEAFANEQAELLESMAFNLNLAPVLDVPYDEGDFIYHRAFSTDVEEVKRFAKAYVLAFNEKNIGTVLKHFPGYGNNIDTHIGVAYDSRSLATLWERDVQPFQVGIENGTEGILVAHNVIEAVDPEWPATLSPKVIRLLRDDMDFDGMIITDDLVMEGLQAFATPEEAAVLAVLAGNDVLISSDFTIQIPAVIEAVEDGRISEKRLDESVLRILKVKLHLGLSK